MPKGRLFHQDHLAANRGRSKSLTSVLAFFPGTRLNSKFLAATQIRNPPPFGATYATAPEHQEHHDAYTCQGGYHRVALMPPQPTEPFRQPQKHFDGQQEEHEATGSESKPSAGLRFGGGHFRFRS